MPTIPMAERAPLTIRLLGEIEVRRGQSVLELPQSKKTRALLGYLVVTGRPQRRDRLCSLLWDVTDDPRGALRWSLSKLRPLVDQGTTRRIVADRETVAFSPAGARVDLFEVREGFAEGVGQLPTERLEELAELFRGELLEGLDLSDFHDFQAWSLGERERARTDRATILHTLVSRCAQDPERALSYARQLARVDSLNAEAHATLVRTLADGGHRQEAAQQLEAAERWFDSLHSASPPALQQARADIERNGPLPAAPRVESPEVPVLPASSAFVGRRREWAVLSQALDGVRSRSRAQVFLIAGEPGAGKTRLLREVAARVREQRGTVLEGAAFEAEGGQPYGPWIEALRGVPRSAVGDTIGADLAPLLPERYGRGAGEGSRDRLFGAVVELLAARAHSAPPVLLVLDDMQWADYASVELLHYVCRMNRHRPLLVALAAREGELSDNPSMVRLLRNLRREVDLEEMRLAPLTLEETRALVAGVADEEKAGLIFRQCAGNPLYAIEMARSGIHDRDIPATLAELVRERVQSLPALAADTLRWAAVLGPLIHIDRLAELAGSGPDGLVEALGAVERHALLHHVREDQAGVYTFSHEIVRQVIYWDLSEPRRQLMHRKIAQVLDTMPNPNETLSAEVAHHAALGGDNAMAARACVGAGRRCLRLFANVEAEAMAKRGVHYAESLEEPERVRLMLELTQIRFGARQPEDPGKAAEEIEALAERALDYGCLEHARLGFTMLSLIHWERGELTHAERETIRAEQISRHAEGPERVIAMGEAARCLTLLERDLAGAEALALEAAALSKRIHAPASVVPDAEGMLRLHRGELDEAAGRFELAWRMGRDTGDRLEEFHGLEHLIMVEIERGDFQRASFLSGQLAAIADKLREGSEAPFARALGELCRYGLGDQDAVAGFDSAVEALRIADAKHRLAYALTRAAGLDLRYDRGGQALARAEDALAVATALGRPSEIALAHVVAVRAAQMLGDRRRARRHREALQTLSLATASHCARESVRAVLEPGAGSREEAGSTWQKSSSSSGGSIRP